jgi:hypothetical protein
VPAPIGLEHRGTTALRVCRGQWPVEVPAAAIGCRALCIALDEMTLRRGRAVLASGRSAICGSVARTLLVPASDDITRGRRPIHCAAGAFAAGRGSRPSLPHHIRAPGWRSSSRSPATNTCIGDGGSAATCHKNAIFGDSNAAAAPFDSLSNPTQESLWSALDTGCSVGPCNAITIPHNSNLSNGQAFNVPQGSEQHAIKYQKLVEIFQHKGGSECFFDPAAPTDPTCDFNYLGGVTEPKLAQSYVRTGVELGLTDQANPALHVKPLQMGIIGATDDHNGAPGGKLNVQIAERAWTSPVWYLP